ncbi:hypothetical protein MLD38_033478 [Melastoma candidum]|uniref:Uncharacterized protein n=1 Tax=Melastoma candidum TaxID=119954 RepID=A0ACB9M719_9MYRT|nr:hypothetical protein MLD38_033478 [Melastoma candidum]
MASSMACSSPSAAMLGNKAVALHPGSQVFPCCLSFPRRGLRKSQRMVAPVRAQGGDNQNGDSKLDVHVSKGGQGNEQQSSAVERRPGRLAVDVSPFGK